MKFRATRSIQLKCLTFVARVGVALIGVASIGGTPLASGQEAETLTSEAFRKKIIAEGGRVDFVFGDDREFSQCHASTLVQAANGSLLCAWFGGTEEKNPDVSVWMSTLDGESWSKPIRAAKVNDMAHWNPVLFRDRGDTLHHFFKVGVDEIHWKTWRAFSRDNGATWSDAVELVAGDVGGRGPVKNKPILLSDGSWLAPASVETKQAEREIWKAFADRSEDRGKTWQRSADFAKPTLRDGKRDRRFDGAGAIQPTFWESEPGKVHSLLRTGSGIIWRCNSEDGGLTWGPYEATDLPNNNSGFDALRLEDGRVVLVYNPVGENWGPRTPLDISVSSDNGLTWETIAHLEDDPNLESEYSYPAIVATEDGVAVCYTWNRERIRCWKIPLRFLNTNREVLSGFAKTTLELADGGRMNCYLRKGTGPTLVLVPGTWGGIWRFEELVAELPATIGIAVVELCWQGGNKPPSLDLSMEQIADNVLKAIEVMELERFVVGGHSIGGMIAVEIAGRDVPGLVGAIPIEGWTHHTVVKTAFDGVLASNLIPRKETPRRTDPERGRSHLSEEELQAIRRIWKKWDGYGCLERSTIPILEIWGDRGRPRPNSKALRIPDQDNIKIAWVTDASHLLLLDDPAEVARLVLEFLEKNN